MGDFLDSENDSCPEVYLNHWEKKCVEEWDREPLEDRVQSESEKSNQRLWSYFQNSASTISHLYKEGTQPTVISLWVPFQAAASSATILYKEGVEATKRSFELGQQYGNYKRTKEVLSWAKKKRRNIQRDELIAFLCGKTVPTKHHRQVGSHRNRNDAANRLAGYYQQAADCRDVDLQLFRDALGFQNQQGNPRRSPSRCLYEDLQFVDPSNPLCRKRCPDRLDSPSSKRQRMEIDDL